MMGICWYCHWGWAKPVADIYAAALAKLDGDESPLEYGPAHIVWGDENWEDGNIDFCIEACNDAGFLERFAQSDIDIVHWSLIELRKIPEDVRCCCPEDYDDERPELFPPTCEVARV